MCILLNVKKHEKTFALNVDIFKGCFYNCVSMGTVILFLYVKESAGMSIAANRMKLNG